MRPLRCSIRQCQEWGRLNAQPVHCSPCGGATGRVLPSTLSDRATECTLFLSKQRFIVHVRCGDAAGNGRIEQKWKSLRERCPEPGAGVSRQCGRPTTL